MSDDLTPRQMRFILAISQTENLSLAASKLGLSQPAGSRMLNEIEKLIGGVLYFRRARGLEPTELGILVTKRVGEIIANIDGLKKETSHFHSGSLGSVRVGAVTSAAIALVAPAILNLKNDAPYVEITVDVSPSRILMERLFAGELDFILSRVLPEFDASELTLTPALEEPMCLLVGKNHPLANQGDMSLKDIFAYEWLLQERGSPIRTAMFNAFHDLSLTEPKNIISVTSILFSIAYVKTSNAIAAVSQEVSDVLGVDNNHQTLANLHIHKPILVPTYYLIKPKLRTLSSAGEMLFADILKRIILRRSDMQTL